MKNELISMVSFTLTHESNSISECLEGLWNYAKFLNQPLNISMFVPAIKVEDKWEVLEMPKECDLNSSWSDITNAYYDIPQYQTAKDNVIFEGWTLANETQSVWAVYDSDNRLVFMKEDGKCLDGKTIQDLIKYKPTLTKKGLDDSGLNR